MKTFTVDLLNFEALAEDEQCYASDNGCGKENANYIRITRNGETLLLQSDAMEPEDASFKRDLGWIKDALLMAYEIGQEDAVKPLGRSPTQKGDGI